MTSTPLNELTTRQIQIQLCQRAIENGAIAIREFEIGIKVIKEKQERRFAELARQTLAEKEASARHPNADLNHGEDTKQ